LNEGAKAAFAGEGSDSRAAIGGLFDGSGGLRRAGIFDLMTPAWPRLFAIPAGHARRRQGHEHHNQ
jgi:hypothetical protein